MSGPQPSEHLLFEMGNVRGEIELQKQKDRDALYRKKFLEKEARQETTVVNRFWAVLAVIIILSLLGFVWLLHLT